MTPTIEWPIGVQYAIVTTVYHHNQFGLPDPTIQERVCLLAEAPEMIWNIRGKNPHATAWVTAVKTWRGTSRE